MPTLTRTSERPSFQLRIPPLAFQGAAGVEQVATLREMLPILETLPVSGQRRHMRQLVTRIEPLVERVGSRLFVAGLLGKLAVAVSRLDPDVRSFNEAAERLLGLLS
jgi:hypothetical protein